MNELNRRLSEQCAVCGSTRAEHGDRVHAFTTTKNDLRERPTPEPQRPRTSVVSTDVALRLALIDSGVLDAKQILAAEHKLGFYADVDAVGQQAEEATKGGG